MFHHPGFTTISRIFEHKEETFFFLVEFLLADIGAGCHPEIFDGHLTF